MRQMPKVADVQCSRIKFEPGDRVIVRSHHRLSHEQAAKLRKSLQKWAGCEIEVLIVDLTQYDVEVDKRSIVGVPE